MGLQFIFHCKLESFILIFFIIKSTWYYIKFALTQRFFIYATFFVLKIILSLSNFTFQKYNRFQLHY